MAFRLKLVPDITRYDFFRWQWLTVGASALAVVVSILATIFMGLNYGIDFRGGTTIRTESTTAFDIGEYRQALDGMGFSDVSITEVFDPSFGTERHVAMVRIGTTDETGSVSPEQLAEVQTALQQVDPQVTFASVESVGPKVSAELIRTAIMAVAAATLGILLYIWLRFEWQFAIGAVVSLLHDIILTVGIFAVFQLIPLGSTIYYSFFEYYRSGLKIIGPTFVGLKNYITLFATDLPKYFGNTLLLWIIGFIPQIAISLLLAAWFTDLRLKLKGQTFFKTVIYMPNLIMASAFAMLFFALFSDNGPVNAALVGMGILKEPFSFLNSVWGNRGLIGLMNFLMWFGNTTIMLMAAIMGVDPTLYEAAELDGCTPNQMFWKITIPLIRPILVYVMITSMIGGLQMFDVPQILTNGKGGPDRTSTTMIMYLNNHLFSKNYGMAGAVSVVLFLVCAVLCVVVYFSLTKEDDGLTRAQRKELNAAKKAAKGGK